MGISLPFVSPYTAFECHDFKLCVTEEEAVLFIKFYHFFPVQTETWTVLVCPLKPLNPNYHNITVQLAGKQGKAWARAEGSVIASQQIQWAHSCWEPYSQGLSIRSFISFFFIYFFPTMRMRCRAECKERHCCKQVWLCWLWTVLCKCHFITKVDNCKWWLYGKSNSYSQEMNGIW